MATILVVDDQEPVRTALQMFLEVHGLAVEAVADPEAAVARVKRGGIALVVQDMNFSMDTTSGEEGVSLFRSLRAADPAMPIVLVTAWTSLETAVALVKEGAVDYVAKPWDDDKLLSTIRTQLRLRELERENSRLRDEAWRDRSALAAAHDLRGLVYESAAMHRIVSLAVQIAASDAPVLIRGANGAGKEKLAEIVQANSHRRAGPFIRVNAGALPDTLLEAELFGAEAGAFTGATRARAGVFEAADGGTLFLDEIGNLPLAGQVKLLRVLQAGELTRLGSTTARKVDVRVISATNADLKRAIEERTFREDLYFRLNVVELVVPELRDRREDIPCLVARFLERANRPAAVLDEHARKALLEHGWSGNVRELENRITRALLVRKSGPITADDLGLPEADLESRRTPEADPTREFGLAELEAALGRHDGNVSRAASELGLSRQALYRRLEKLGAAPPRKPKS